MWNSKDLLCNTYTLCPKKEATWCVIITCGTDLQNSFTNWLVRKFSMYLLQRFPPHLQYVAILPYEIIKSKNVSEFLRWTWQFKLWERAFCVSGPLVWNSLPESLRTVDCITTFRRRLKTHFFNLYLLWFYLYSSSF